jgi:predicted PurR-regulated permease PerM
MLLAAIVGTGYFIGPRMKNQADDFLRNYPTYLKDADNAIWDFAEDHPTLNQLLHQSLGERKPEGTSGAAEKDRGESRSEGNNEGNSETRPTKAAGNGKQGPGAEQDKDKEQPQESKRRPILQPLVEELLAGTDEEKGTLKNAFERLKTGVGVVWGLGSSFFLSLLFSFLIVMDLPKLTRQVQGLANTKIGFIYSEVAENIRDFGKVVGRALEAQLFIAVTNTVLTGIGIYFMGLPPLAFLCTIVFFCSFIPVAGVFISSVPICLVALQQSGISLMLIAIALILVIHFIEAYFLNPRIYGHHLRMNAVLVLIVLTIGGTLFGFWGLVLGLPIMNYVFRQAIHRPEDFGLSY